MIGLGSTEDSDFKQDYKREIGKKVTFVVGSLVVLMVMMVLSCAIGTGYGFFETYQIIVERIMGETPQGISEWWADHYVCDNILPGVVAAVIAGSGLSLSGAVMQSMMGNPQPDISSAITAKGA